MAVNIKGLYGNSGKKIQVNKYSLECSLTVFTFVFACCVVISPIHYDVSDFLYPEFPL